MKISIMKSLLLASVMLVVPVGAHAQQMAEPPADAVSPDDPSLQAVSDADAKATDADAKMALLQAQLEALQTQLDEVKKAQATAAPVWKGAPQYADPDSGFSWKVRGRFMMDTAWMSTPDNLNPRNFGFNTRVRRVRLGVEGTLPGDFGYKAEMDFANSNVGFGDVVLSWNPHKGPVTLTLGNQESLDGMEQITSSRWSSFIERAQVNDAFGNTRRLGLVVGFKSKDNLFRLDGGLFAAHSIDASLDNKGWIAAARATYTPYVGPGFVHLGLNYQHREFQENNGEKELTVGTGSPSAGQLVSYRARPFLQTTSQRFVDTGSFAAKGDDIFGAELYGVFKSLHIGGEAQYAKVRAYSPGDTLSGADQFSAVSQVVPTGNPSFWGGHFEVGYFLTGETRGYKNGLWDRTKVLNPVDKGGMGAFQIIGRVDYLDLQDSKLQNGCTNDFTTGACAPLSAGLSKGGSQTGYLAGLTWMPTDYVRFLVNYIHTEVEGGPFAATVKPTSTAPVDGRKYSSDAVAVRAQFDF
ncbi:OprO/OprP family phosphate-selective porin [Rhizorhapis suberifaciens]|uniref:Phosphate-selective porin OprO/OprP n=1 Tax=Rhizorhapis suberifaciens TaxID=13656 RepID=A0A840HYN3_9SPHN|nr:porin [Rhizorhapis suberifaciens]MBB4642526.1 phosphate-selective porin OprO/OprP [Rhizorhapis suberifaciens]